jgi:hypothetical protein
MPIHEDHTSEPGSNDRLSNVPDDGQEGWQPKADGP